MSRKPAEAGCLLSLIYQAFSRLSHTIHRVVIFSKMKQTFTQYIDQVTHGNDMSREQAVDAARMIFEGDLDDATIADFLVALANKGETAAEIAAFASVLVNKAVPVDAPEDAVDLCGTGGGEYSRFNVSTAAAFVAAACGVPIAKHGNKGSRQPNGSFDLLEALELPIVVPPEIASESLRTVGVTFLYARQYHPIMKTVAPARKIANRRTIFNLIGPLSNPANVGRQVIGTAEQSRVNVLAEALQLLGRKRALVVTGEPGIDELSVSGASEILEINPTITKTFSLQPEDIGIPCIDYEKVPAGQAAQNADIFLDLLENKGHESIHDMVALNAGAVVYVAGKAQTIQEGYAQAKEAIVDGRMKAKFEEYQRFMNTHCAN